MRSRLSEQLGHWGRVLALAGGILTLVGLALLLVYSGPAPTGEILLAAGLLLLLVVWFAHPGVVRDALTSRSTRYGTSLAVMGLALVGLIVLLNVASYRYYGRWDMTKEGLYSLSSQTQALLDQVDRPVQVTAFFYPEQRQEELEARDLLEAYAGHNRFISYRIVDPEVKRSLAEQYGFSGLSYALVFESGDKRHTVYTVAEQTFASAILRVTRDRRVTVYFLDGHGEREIGDEEQGGYSNIADLLSQASYELETLNLITHTGALPVGETIVVLAGPRFPLREGERDLLADYLRRGGKLLALLDPDQPADLNPLLEPWGVQVEDSLIVDPDNALAGLDPTIPVHYYAKGDHPISKDLPSTFYPGARPVTMTPDRPADLQVTPLLGTSDSSWAESNLEEQPMAFDPEEDRPGPIFLAIAVQGRQADQEQALSTRLVVVGDSDFAGNGYAGGNYQFFLNAINWLAEEEDLIDIAPVTYQDRQLVVNASQARAIRYLTLAGWPLLVAGSGVVVWLRRRKR